MLHYLINISEITKHRMQMGTNRDIFRGFCDFYDFTDELRIEEAFKINSKGRKDKCN